ncbi:MAG: hypothetical protein AMXMBFR64_56480 [Myxococcales bacterium]
MKTTRAWTKGIIAALAALALAAAGCDSDSGGNGGNGGGSDTISGADTGGTGGDSTTGADTHEDHDTGGGTTDTGGSTTDTGGGTTDTGGGTTDTGGGTTDTGGGTTDTGGGTTDTGGGSTDTGGGTTDMGTWELPPNEDVQAPEGACMNEADQAEIDANSDAIKKEAQSCGLSCMSNADPKGCATTCMEEKTELSGECGACYAGIVACAIKNCIAKCAADANSPACVECMEGAGCYDEFETCSGIVSEG